MTTVNVNNYTQRNLKNTISVLVWSILWAGSLVAACYALKFWWPQNEVMLILAAIVHLGCALGALKAHQNWLKGLDELQKKIQLHSMALTLGVTWMGITLLVLVSSSSVVEFEKFYLPALAVVMVIAGTLGNIIGMRKAS
jgi:hypothetical protein